MDGGVRSVQYLIWITRGTMIINKATGNKITPTMFPDGTSQVWHLDEADLSSTEPWWYFEHEGEIMHLLQYYWVAGIKYVVIPYLPYGRQDKAVENDQTFALHPFRAIFRRLLESRTVYTVDLHSAQYRAEFVNIRPDALIEAAFDASGAETLVFPDLGARMRYHDVGRGPMVYFEKKRDADTGRITSLRIEDETAKEYIQGKRILIADDICDGGMTFIKMAGLLKDMGAANVDLYVTHALLTKGVDVLYNAGINTIHTAQTLWKEYPKGVIVYPIDEIVRKALGRSR